METLISSMIASGRSVNRPPHILLLILCRSYSRLPGGVIFETPARPVATEALHSRILYRMTNDMPDALPPQNPPSRRIVLVLGTLLVGAVAGSLAIYGVAGSVRHARAEQPCASALETAKRIAPLAIGEVAALTMATKPLQLPDLAFVDGTARRKKLSSALGRLVFIHLWAHW